MTSINKTVPYAIYVSPDTVNQSVANRVVRFLIPKELTLDNLLEVFEYHKIEHRQNEKWVEKCQQFLIELYHKEVNSNDHFDHVPLMTKILSKKFGDKKSRAPFYYKTIIDVLEKCKLINVNQHYVASNGKVKGESKSYKLTLKDSTMLVFNEKATKIIELKRTNFLFHDQLKRLTLDEHIFFTLLTVAPNKLLQGGMHFYHSWIFGEFYSFNDKNDRIHTPIHSLKKLFRDSIRFNGKPLYEVDISSSQPYLLLSHVITALNYCKKNKKTLTAWASEYDDLRLYIDLIQNGDLYKYLLSKHKGRKKISKSITQKDLAAFKEKFFACVLFSDYLIEDNKIVKIFKSEFPTIYESIIFYHKKNKYEHLANSLQKIESQIVEKTIKEFQFADSDIGLRFHDAILVNKEILNDMNEALNKNMLNLIGVKGRVCSRRWGQPISEILTSHYYNPLAIRHSRNRDKLKKRNSYLQKSFLRLHTSKRYPEIKISDLINFYETNEWYSKRSAQVAEVKLNYPDHYSDVNLHNLKLYMKKQFIQAQDGFLEKYPMLELWRNSSSNLLYSNVGIRAD